VELLVRKGALLDAKDNVSLTLVDRMHWAPDCLIKAGASPLSLMQDGFTPLHWACSYSHMDHGFDYMEYNEAQDNLMELGANRDVKANVSASCLPAVSFPLGSADTLLSILSEW
jgi:ankyrin repeat protein